MDRETAPKLPASYAGMSKAEDWAEDGMQEAIFSLDD